MPLWKCPKCSVVSNARTKTWHKCTLPANQLAKAVRALKEAGGKPKCKSASKAYTYYTLGS